ncbi:MAG: hypothetical protein ACE5I3_10495 [Phycisphaerae bacterium]
MIRLCPPIQRPFRPPKWRGRLVPLLCLWPGLAAAQPAGPPTVGQRQQIRIAASERSLWLAAITESGSRLLFREAGGGFDLGRSTNHRIAAMAAFDRDLLVFFDDAAVYRYLPDTATRPTAESVLPRRQVPLDMVAEAGLVYAIIPSVTAGELPPATADDAMPSSQPFDPGDAPLSLARYDGHSWSAVAPLPPLAHPVTDTRLRPRLCLARGKLLLFSPAEQPGQVLYFHLDVENHRWVSRGNVGIPGMTGFWVVNFANNLTFVAASPRAGGRETVKALRLLGDVAQADATAWRPAELKLSDLPEGIRVARYAGAVAFNQHLGLLSIAPNGDAYLRFARVAGPPAEPTQTIAEVLAERGMMRQTRGLLQMFTFVLLLAVLTGLFVFRRGSMVNLVELPPGCALVLHMQRMLGWLIDFAPFTLAAAVMLDVPWGEGLVKLARWGIKPGPEGSLPRPEILQWWALSVSGHTAYMLVMELLARRTVGKVFARVYLLSESGARPAAWSTAAPFRLPCAYHQHAVVMADLEGRPTKCR